MAKSPNRKGKVLIFRPFITGKNGQKIFPRKGKVFPIWVNAEDVHRQ